MFSTGLSLLNPRRASLKVAPNLFCIVCWLFEKVVDLLEAGALWRLMDASVTCRQEGSWRLVFSPFFLPSFTKVPQIGVRYFVPNLIWQRKKKKTTTCKSDMSEQTCNIFPTQSSQGKLHVQDWQNLLDSSDFSNKHSNKSSLRSLPE